jgi:hypothetical protein
MIVASKARENIISFLQSLPIIKKYGIQKKITTTTFGTDFSKYLPIVCQINFNVSLTGGGGGVVSKSENLCVVIPLPGKFMKGSLKHSPTDCTAKFVYTV